MGLFEKLRNELIDIVEWIDDDHHTLVWRFPRYHNEIKNGAQLIVRPGQAAVFVHEGKIADVFPPGRVQLTTQNLPVLSTLMGWKYGFNSPFRSEVYFVNTTQVTDLKWGTPNPIMLRDPDFGPIRLRAFGTYAVRCTEPKALITQLVGTDGRFETEELAELLRAMIASAFAELIGKSQIAALDLAANYRALSDELRKTTLEKVDDEYGLDIPQLFIVNVSFPEEVEKALDARTSMGVLGDMGRYQQYQMGQAIPLAAQNPAGGLAGAGVGLGMGFAMAQQMAPAFGPSAPAPPTIAFHVAVSGQSQGPFTPQQLATSGLTPQSLVWAPGMAAWTPAGQVPELAALFRRSVPPPPPPPAPAP